MAMLVNIAMPVTAVNLKEETKIASEALNALKTKAKLSSTPVILSVERVNELTMTSRITSFVKMMVISKGLDNNSADSAINTILEYLKSKNIRSPTIVKIKWLPNSEESLTVIHEGEVVFDSYVWFYGTKFVEKSQNLSSVKSVYWSDYKRFYKVFDVYNVYGIKIATWTYDVGILTEISPSSRIPLTGTGYIEGTINVRTYTEGYTFNKPAVLIGNGPANGYAFNTHIYETMVRITTPQDLGQITCYDHFAAGTGSILNAYNGDITAIVSLGVALGPLSFSVTNNPDDKFIRAIAADNYGREIKIINRFNPWHLTGFGGNTGVYFDGGHMSFSLKCRVGDCPSPFTGNVQVSYKINYVAVQGAVEFHSFGSNSYTATLEFRRG